MTVKQQGFWCLFLSLVLAGSAAFGEDRVPQRPNAWKHMPTRGICAHRGASDTHPENTIAAFREAIRLGAHMIEFDVALTGDGALVLLHDATLDRTTNGTGPVSARSLGELQALDAGVDAVWPGCDLWPDVPAENMEALVSSCHDI